MDLANMIVTLGHTVRDGKFAGGQVYTFNIRNKGIGIPASNPNLTPAIQKRIGEFADKIASGQLKVSERP